MEPRTQMKFLADPAWSRDQASWWPCHILNTRVPHGDRAEVAALGSSVRRVRNWKRQGPFFGGIPWAVQLLRERTEPRVVLGVQELWKQPGQHQTPVAVLSLQHSKMLYCRGFIFFPGLQPALAMCTAWMAKYTLSGISDRRKWALSAFSYHFCNRLARCWSKASSLCQNKQHFWGCGATLVLCI